MRAIVLEGIRNLQETEIETPKPDGKRPIIKIMASGICGSELHVWDAVDRPGMIFGHEFSGILEDPGDRKDLKAGDHVGCLSTTPCGVCRNCQDGKQHLCLRPSVAPGVYSAKNIGAYAEYFMPVDSSYVYKLADSVSFEEAALAEPAVVTMRSVAGAGVGFGDRVLVAGGGIIGAMTAQWAKTLGARYVALTELNENRAKRVMELGYVDATFDPRDPDFTAQILSATAAPTFEGGGGFDVFLDCSGSGAAIQNGMSVLKRGGRMVLVGIVHEPIQFSLMTAIIKQVTIQGIIGYTPTMFADCLEAIANGSYPVKHYHTKSIDFSGVQAAFEELMSPGCDQFKIMIYPQGLKS